MPISVSRTGVTTVLFVALGCVTFTKDVRAHITVSCNPSQNKIKLIWGFPCADHPENGQEQARTDGSPQGPPPADVCLDPNPPFKIQQNPYDFNNLVYGNGCCTGGEGTYSLFVTGCAHAGGSGMAVRANQAATDQPAASVGLPGTADSTMSLHVERIVTPGPTPDIVNVTLVGGGLQTHVASGSEHANVTLKLMVYPDAATADADSTLLSGAGSVFFGQITLVGESGSLLAEQGFSAADFLLQNDGGGTYTARPTQPLTKTAFVPDASTAVVTVVGDPNATPENTTGVPGPSVASGLWLGEAFPNPAPGETQIGFGIPHSAHVSLAIYDHQGRRVRELVNGNLPAGEHRVLWDGRDTAGRRVPNALYFYRLLVEGKKLTGKVFTIH